MTMHGQTHMKFTSEAFSLKILMKCHSVMSESFLVTSAIPYSIHTV